MSGDESADRLEWVVTQAYAYSGEWVAGVQGEPGAYRVMLANAERHLDVDGRWATVSEAMGVAADLLRKYRDS